MESRSERAWLGNILALAAIAGIVSLVIGFSAPWTIQDDARQFIFWMAEWRDEALFRGDLVAEYWRSVSPWLFVFIFRAIDFLSIEPITAARIMPMILFPATAFFAFRFARAISDDPSVAYLGAFLVLVWLIVEDGVISATPRAFAPLFLLIFLDGVARRSMIAIAAGLFCLAGTYPNVAMVAGTALGVILIDFTGRPKFAFTKANLALFAAGAGAALLGVAPFLLESTNFGPTVTPDTAKAFPTFGPGGRSSLFTRDGTIDFFCGSRIGIFPGLGGCNSWTSPVFWLALLAVALPPALVFMRYRRTGGVSGSPIPLAILLAALAWFVIGIVLAFRLHIPSRFIVRTVPIMSVLCIGLLIGAFFRARLQPGTRNERLSRYVGGGVLIALFAVLSVTRLGDFYNSWKRPALAEAVISYPVGTVFAGFVRDTDNIPIFAKRRVLFSEELAVAYHLGYYRQIDARMRDMVDVELTPDAAMLAERLERNDVDVYLVEADRLADPLAGRNVVRFLGDFVEQQKARFGDAPTALMKLAPACSRGRFDEVEVLDARCLIAAAR